MVEATKAKKIELKEIVDLLHFARKAGKLIMGTAASEQSLQRHKAKVCILAEDASARTKTNIMKLSGETPLLICSSKEELGAQFGRKELGILIVEDGNFAHGIMRRVK
ncbi:MAG: ribosomal L7Ae/L30e/S12e/Gadd45 family protein [Candidatus Cloacimonadales bacterium]